MKIAPPLPCQYEPVVSHLFNATRFSIRSTRYGKYIIFLLQGKANFIAEQFIAE